MHEVIEIEGIRLDREAIDTINSIQTCLGGFNSNLSLVVDFILKIHDEISVDAKEILEMIRYIRNADGMLNILNVKGGVQ